MTKKVAIFVLALLLLVSCGGDSVRGFVIEGDPDNPYLTWIANTEADLAGYRVYWGPEPGVYVYVLDVELDRIVYIYSLNLFETTYFVVTAYDTSGNESGFSSEVRWPK